MKKLVQITLFISLITTAVFSQNKNDSKSIFLDTINVNGCVVDEFGKPVVGATVLSETYDEKYNLIRTLTNKNGNFELKGISPKGTLRIRNDDSATEKKINSSRYFLIVLQSLPKRSLNNGTDAFSIDAKRVATKKKYEIIRKDTTIYLGFHPFGHFSNAMYKGGIGKFYQHIQNNLKYPKQAIVNNAEGLVAVEFTIDQFGVYKDFIIIRDIGYGCAKELIKVIKNSKNWEPAMNGRNVAQKIEIEIPFKLID